MKVSVPFDGHVYEAELMSPKAVKFSRDGAEIGTGRWLLKSRRLKGVPGQIPPEVVPLLDSTFRAAWLAEQVATRYVPDRSRDFLVEFAKSGGPDMSNAIRWADTSGRQRYVVFVLPDNDSVVFRNGIPVGKAIWDPKANRCGPYVGEHLPPNVWETLSRRLTEWNDTERLR